jgi:hypothetical protein
VTAGSGTLSDNGDTTWTFTPTADWSGAVSFGFDVDDGSDTTANTATLTVDPVNDAPTVTAVDLGSIDEDNSRVITQADLLAGSSDTEGDPLSAVNLAVTAGSGTLSDNGDTTWTFTPTADWSGAVSFSFDVDDGGDTTPNTASLTVDPVNDAPTLVNPIPDQGATEDTAFSFTLAAGTFSDSDAGDSLSYMARLSSGSALPGWLSFDAGSRTFSGTPGNDDTGILSLRVIATDTAGATVSDDFELLVSAVNDAPAIGNNNLTLNAGDTVVLRPGMLSASDIDSAEPGLTFTISGISGGQFERLSVPGTAISAFTQAELVAGEIVFVDDGDDILPAYSVTVSDGTDSDGPSAATISFAPPDTLVVPVDPTAPEATDPSPPPAVISVDPVPEAPDPEPEPDPLPEEHDEPEPEVDAPLAEEPGRPGDTVESDYNEVAVTHDIDMTFSATGNAMQNLLQGLLVRPAALAAMAMPGTGVPEFALDETSAAIRAVLTSAGFNDSLDRMRDGVNNATLLQQGLVGSGAAVTTGLSVGYVAWLVRGGVLLSTALSSLPAWQFIDPLPVLARTRDDEDDGADDSLESIIKKQAARDANPSESGPAGRGVDENRQPTETEPG